MKRILIITILFFSSICVAEETLNERFVAAAQKIKPSVVLITTYVRYNNTIKLTGYGTGTIISEKGHLVTNFHVVKGSTEYRVQLSDGSEYGFCALPNGGFYLADEQTDLAVMKIKAPGRTFVPAVIGDSKKLQEGEWVIAVGNPYGLANTITSGIVSSVNRSDVGFTDIEDFIQTDVPINPGNSGGPLVNLDGEVVGINTAIRTVSGGYQGISFSIPSDIVISVFNELNHYGYVRRGWLGILVKEALSGRSGSKSVYVHSVLKNSPAEKVGLKYGDVIREADSSTVNSKSQLLKIVKSKSVGSRLNLVIDRGGEIKHFSFVMHEKKHYQTLEPVMKSLYDHYGIELDLNATGKNIVVSDTSPLKIGSHRNLLKQGDIIRKLNGHPTKSIDEFAQVFSKSGYLIDSIEVVRDKEIYTIQLMD